MRRVFKKLPPVLSILMLPALLLSCSQTARPSPASQVETPGSKGVAPVGKADWQEKWESVVVDARKEGTVAIYTTWAAGLRLALVKPFKDRFGIDLEISPFGRGSEQVAKMQAEQRAGLYLADAIGGGATTALGALKPAGLLSPMEPLLILPEVSALEHWIGGRFPFVDRDKTYVAMIFGKQIYIIYNTNLVKAGEVTTYKDVLKPQFARKITLNDPTVAGVGNNFMAHLAHNIWNVEEAGEFLRRLIKEQGVVIQRDGRLHVEDVARGKFAIGLAPKVSVLNEFIPAGAPIGVVDLKEGTDISTGSGGLSIANRLAHPNATAVFVNWLLSKEGQTIFSRAYGAPSMRTDVSSEGLPSFIVAKPGEKLFVEGEEDLVQKTEIMEMTRKIIERR